MKKKTNRIILLCVFLFILLLVLQFILSGNLPFMYSKNDIIKNEKFSIDNMKNISVNVHSSNVILHVTKDKNLKIVQYGRKSKTSKFVSHVDNQEIKITQGKNYSNMCFILCIGATPKIEIYLPEKYQDNINLSTTSGNIQEKNSNGMSHFNQVILQARSGNIRYRSQLKAKKITLSTTSGNITGNTIIGSQINIKANSGNIRMEQVSGKTIASLKSGNLRINALENAKNSEFQVRSGNIRIKLEQKEKYDIYATAKSGTVHYPDNNKNATWKLYAKSNSGNIFID